MTTTLQQDAQLASFAVLAYSGNGLLPSGQPPTGWESVKMGSDTILLIVSDPFMR